VNAAASYIPPVEESSGLVVPPSGVVEVVLHSDAQLALSHVENASPALSHDWVRFDWLLVQALRHDSSEQSHPEMHDSRAEHAEETDEYWDPHLLCSHDEQAVEYDPLDGGFLQVATEPPPELLLEHATAIDSSDTTPTNTGTARFQIAMSKPPPQMTRARAGCLTGSARSAGAEPLRLPSRLAST
jgi:hypothetical protein